MFGQERQENAKLQKDMECANNAEIYAVKSQLILNGLQAGVIMMFKICGIFLALYLWKNGVVSVADVVLVLLLLVDVLKYFERFLYDVTLLRTNLGKLDDSLKFLRVPHEIVNAPNAQLLKLRKGKNPDILPVLSSEKLIKIFKLNANKSIMITQKIK